MLLPDAGEMLAKLPLLFVIERLASDEGGLCSNWGKIRRAKEHWTLHTESSKISARLYDLDKLRQFFTFNELHMGCWWDEEERRPSEWEYLQCHAFIHTNETVHLAFSFVSMHTIDGKMRKKRKESHFVNKHAQEDRMVSSHQWRERVHYCIRMRRDFCFNMKRVKLPFQVSRMPRERGEYIYRERGVRGWSRMQDARERKRGLKQPADHSSNSWMTRVKERKENKD